MSDRLVRKSATMIQKYGAAGTLSRSTPGPYDPATSAATVVTQTFAVYVVETEDKSGSTLDESMMSGSAVAKALRKFLLSASGLSIVPSPGDVLVVSGHTWTITEASPVRMSGETVMYTLRGACT